MAVVFGDTFDDYTTVADKWAVTQAGTSTATIGAWGRFGTNGMRLSGGAFSSITVTRTLPSSYSTIIVGFSYKPDFTGGSNSPYISLKESGTNHIYLEHNRTSGTMSIYREGGTLLATGPTIPTASALTNYFELKATIHDTTGSVELRMNEEVVASATGIDTRNGGTGVVNQVTLWMGDNNAGNASVYYDDILVDTSTYHGDVRGELITPNGNGNHSDFVGSDADQTDNYQLVDEIPHNSDTDYVESNTLDAIDTYAMSNLVTTTGDVVAVITHMVAKKDDAGTRGLIPVFRIGVTNYTGTTRQLSTDYANYSEIFETSPDTVGAWTISEINSMEIGEKVA